MINPDSLEYKLALKDHDRMLLLYNQGSIIEASLICHNLIGILDTYHDEFYRSMIEQISQKSS